MAQNTKKTSRWIAAAAWGAILFGGLTIFAGGSVLFGSEAARLAAGNFVPFVLWFNFLAGFAYVLAGIGLFMGQRWASVLACFIFVTTALVFGAFALHIFSGSPYEVRTIGAMTLRTTVWLLIAIISRKLWASPHEAFDQRQGKEQP